MGTVTDSTFTTVPLVVVHGDISYVIGTASVDVELMKKKAEVDGKGLPLSEITACNFKFEKDK